MVPDLAVKAAHSYRKGWNEHHNGASGPDQVTSVAQRTDVVCNVLQNVESDDAGM
jgi:hypothetical protein